MKEIYDVIVIGGGASGMMSAIQSARRGFKTLIIEHNEKLGKKLYITGKGRCNLTNNSPVENHIQNIVRNPKFMYTALNIFSPQDCMEFFSSYGLKLKTERGNRVFPESDKSSDVINTLVKALKNYHVKIELNFNVVEVRKDKNLFYIRGINGVEYTTNCVVVATGGVSYPGSGATDFGLKIAKNFGHNIIELKSALCPLKLKDDISALNGLSLKNVSLAIDIGKKKFTETGEMMFTYDSITGPIALTLSSKINRENLANAKIFLDLKIGLDEQKLDQKLQREFKEFSRKNLNSYLETLLPKRFVDFFMAKIGLENKKLSEITKSERVKIIKTLKKFDFSLKSLDNISTGVVTSGGVDVKEINSATCESKLVPNLYFVGEVLDVDALTGGYNLQIAWSTGYLAGVSLKGN